MPELSAYQGRTVALLTQHGKEQVIAPALEPHLDCVVKHVTGFDTDQLGTFTRDIPRPATQLEAVRRKARKGMELSGLSIGLASEGSFGPDPFSGLFLWNVELLVWIDDDLGIEVVGIAQGTARSGHLQASDWSAVETFAASEGFPQHHLVLRSNGQDDLRIFKGIADWARLKSVLLPRLHGSVKQRAGLCRDGPEGIRKPESNAEHRTGGTRPASAPKVALPRLQNPRLLGDRKTGGPFLCSLRPTDIELS
jgi:hypothetical protein